MKVLDQVLEKLERGKVHLVLIDPDEQKPSRAGDMACTAMDAGTDGIMIGGSTAEDQYIVDKTVCAIKEVCSVPTILFPGGTRGLSPNADAIFYISLLNSSDPYFITGAHAETAHLIRDLDIEVIPVGYIVVEPGMTVAKMGRAEVIPRDRPDLASSYAMVAEFFGMEMAYLEAGSGADRHVPPEMIRETRSNAELPLIVGGGIRTVSDAKSVAASGADIIVQGSAVEEDRGAEKRVADVIKCLKTPNP